MAASPPVNVRQQLLAQLAAHPSPCHDQAQLNNALRLLAKWRSVLIQNTVLQQHGTRVWQGLHTRVLAFDLNPVAQQTCAALAAKNGVADRVQVGALFQPQDFAAHAPLADKRVLVFCDIEGAERDLLDPVAAPALASMDIIVE